jgi:hypothetical protein
VAGRPKWRLHSASFHHTFASRAPPTSHVGGMDPSRLDGAIRPPPVQIRALHEKSWPQTCAQSAFPPFLPSDPSIRYNSASRAPLTSYAGAIDPPGQASTIRAPPVPIAALCDKWWSQTLAELRYALGAPSCHRGHRSASERHRGECLPLWIQRTDVRRRASTGSREKTFLGCGKFSRRWLLTPPPACGRRRASPCSCAGTWLGLYVTQRYQPVRLRKAAGPQRTADRRKRSKRSESALWGDFDANFLEKLERFDLSRRSAVLHGRCTYRQRTSGIANKCPTRAVIRRTSTGTHDGGRTPTGGSEAILLRL